MNGESNWPRRGTGLILHRRFQVGELSIDPVIERTPLKALTTELEELLQTAQTEPDSTPGVTPIQMRASSLTVIHKRPRRCASDRFSGRPWSTIPQEQDAQILRIYGHLPDQILLEDPSKGLPR